MKILIDLTSLADNFSGIERYAAEMSRELVEYSENDYVLVFKERIFEGFADLKDRANIKMEVLKRCGKLRFYQVRLCRFLNRYKADIYFFPAFPSPLFLKKKKKTVVTVHDLCCWDCPETMNVKSRLYFRAGLKNEIKKSAKILTVSEFSKGRIIEKFNIPENKIVVTYNGISDKFLNIKEDFAEDAALDFKYGLPRKYILSLSTIEPRKNIALLLRAYCKIVKEGKTDADLVLAGRDGWKNSTLMDEIAEDVKSRIHFTGFIEEEHLPYIYNRAQLFVFPSKYEGFGIPPLEALACRTPVVSSDAASLPEVLGDCVIYFKSNDLQDLIKSIDLSLNAQKTINDEAVMERVRSYSWKVGAKKIIEVFNSLK